ncbi:hypothetical protein AD998_07510 [bacterium 336/3]|nr:hypothetical protein AD998_07510 [bacterium 336/3]
MRGFFSSMMGKKKDIYFDLPEELRGYNNFRALHKNIAGTSIRVDGGNTYVTSYKCPISEKILAQSLGTKQPQKTNDGWLFDAIDDFLHCDDLGFVPAEGWIVANCFDTPNFTDYRSFYMLRPSVGAYDSVFFGNLGSSNIFNVPSNMRMNNVPSTNFASLPTFKAMSGEHTGSYSDHVLYVGGTGGVGGVASLNGVVKDILFFSQTLTNSERIALMNYLTSYHSL